MTPDDVRLEAVSPTGRVIRMNGDGMYHAQFGPEEIGLYLKEFLCHTHGSINRYNTLRKHGHAIYRDFLSCKEEAVRTSTHNVCFGS